MTTTGWSFRVFYDGECPLCAREIALIRRLDRNRGRVDLVDFSAEDFDAEDYGLVEKGLPKSDLEARIHGMLPDGRVIEGVDVFVELYSAVGWGWITVPAGWPGFRQLLDLAYVWFAKNRLRLTGRTPKVCEVESGDQPGAAISRGISTKSG